MSARVAAIEGAAVASGLVGGVLFAFSSFVMPALRHLPAPEGVSAMQAINRHATTFAFGALMIVTVLLAAGTGVDAFLHRDAPGAGWVGLGTLAILTAAAITGGYHVPRNDRLATYAAASPEAAHYWRTYVVEWTTANHVRAACCVVAAAAYGAALRQV